MTRKNYYLIAVLLTTTAALSSCQSTSIKTDQPSASTLKMMAKLNDTEAQYIAPFQVFDNLYYVGVKWVSAWAIDTGSSIVLIDSLYGPYISQLEQNLIDVGLDPANVSHVLVTHGHFDHAGGARHFQQQYGAQVVMTEPDWKLVRFLSQRPPNHPWAFDMPESEIIARDGEILRVGKLDIKLYVTPGHTKGVLSIMFPVQDGVRQYDAFTWGGFGLNFRGAGRTRMYLNSIERIKTLPFDLLIPNHPMPPDFFAQMEKLKTRTNPEFHPLVNRERFIAILDEYKKLAQIKLKKETNVLSY